MKHPLERDQNFRFSGSLRHYHRAGGQNQRSWEEWVEGRPVRKGSGNWMKIIAISVAVLSLCAIVVGLIVELQ